MSNTKKVPESPYGIWKVCSYTYDGVIHHGIWNGNIMDIAMHISNVTSPMSGTQGCAPLTFEAIDIKQPEIFTGDKAPKYNDVKIVVKDIGTYPDSGPVVAKKTAEFLEAKCVVKNRLHVVIKNKNEVTLHYTSDEEIDTIRKLDSTLSKLSSSEQELLKQYFRTAKD